MTILTYLHIVIGEMIPKSIALQHAERTVLWIAPVMRLIQLIVLPFVIVLNGIGNAVLRLFGVRRIGRRTSTTARPRSSPISYTSRSRVASSAASRRSGAEAGRPIQAA